MERKISDMIDDIQDDTVCVEGRTPLSHWNIKKMVADEIQVKQRVNLRWLGKVAVVAAVLMALTITAFATDVVIGEGRLIKTFLGKELSQRQMDMAEDIGRDFVGSVTNMNGATITPISAVADEHNLFLHIRVQAPEGVILPDLDEEAGYYYDIEPAFTSEPGAYRRERLATRIEYFFDDGFQYRHTMSSLGCSVVTLDDPDPTDNVKEFVLRYHSEDNYAIFNGPWEKFVHIYGLFVRKKLDSYTEELFSGVFVFEAGVHDDNRENAKMELKFDGVTFHNEDYVFDTTVYGLVITPLSITVKYTSTYIRAPYIFSKGGPIQLVMKDGSVIDAVPAYEDVSEQDNVHPDSVVGVGNVCLFENIVVLDDIDYVLIGGTYRIEVD